MASSNSHQAEGGDFYAAAPYRAREGVIMRRTTVRSTLGEVQLQIDHLDGVHQLSNEQKVEAKSHKNFINQLAGLKSKTRRLKLSAARGRVNHVKYVVLFAAAVCFIGVYLWFKFSKKMKTSNFFPLLGSL